MSSATPRKAAQKKDKKPYHVKRADLQLDEYIDEQNAKDPRLLLRRGLEHLRYSTQFRVYVLLQILAVYLDHGLLMIIVGLLWAMLANTGKRQAGEKSAYSLFNEGVEAIAGSPDMEAIEREIRTRGP